MNPLYSLTQSIHTTHTYELCSIAQAGSKNTDELHHLMGRVMVRRQKKDVLKQLPPKRRHKVRLTCFMCIYVKMGARGHCRRKARLHKR